MTSTPKPMTMKTIAEFLGESLDDWEFDLGAGNISLNRPRPIAHPDHPGWEGFVSFEFIDGHPDCFTRAYEYDEEGFTNLGYRSVVWFSGDTEDTLVSEERTMLRYTPPYEVN